MEDEADLGGPGPTFNPPLYRQRYNSVLEVARKQEPAKVLDMGCSGCKLLRQLKRESYVEELVGVDVDGVQLNLCKWLVQPLNTDFLSPRARPLTVRLMQGSITEADSRLVDFDLIACVEVIEHLDPPVLAKVPEVMFGALAPKVVAVTTPNAEFNVLFPGFSGFRHPDHRFEWTRREFQAWCCDVCRRYPYTVEFSGVGAPPEGKSLIGDCSQMAVFTRRQGASPTPEHGAGFGTPYTIIAECAHPYDKNPLSPKEKLCHEAEYYLGVLLRRLQEEEEEEEDGDQGECADPGRRGSSEDPEEDRGGLADTKASSLEEGTASTAVLVPLEDLLLFPRVKSLCKSVEDIRSALQQYSRIVEMNSLGTHAVYCHDDDSDVESDSGTEDGIDCAPTGESHSTKDVCVPCGEPLSSGPSPEEYWD